MAEEDLRQIAGELGTLLKMSVFPRLPTGWSSSVETTTWHSKVCRTFTELNKCNLQSFAEICARMEGELQVCAK
jgi:hypothetical protein